MTPEIATLIENFGAQDVGAHLKVFHLGEHINVADWVEGNKMWVLNDAGRAFLSENSVVESANTSASDDKPKRKPKAKAEDELNLDDI